MGTNYSMSGAVWITPALNFAEIQKAKDIALKLLTLPSSKKHATPDTVFESYMPLKIETEEFDKETPEGVLHIVRGVTLIPSHSPGSLSYDMNTLVVALQKGLPGHNWDGEVVAVHEDVTKAYKLVCTTEPGSDQSTVKQIEGSTYVRWEDGSQDEQIVSLT